MINAKYFFLLSISILSAVFKRVTLGECLLAFLLCDVEVVDVCGVVLAVV